jgi:hypothetical protein
MMINPIGFGLIVLILYYGVTQYFYRSGCGRCYRSDQ